MNSRKRARRHEPEAQGNDFPDVGDESSFFGSARGADRKVKQLCREVHRTVSEILSGEVADDRIAGLLVDSVEPAPDASRLAVVLLLPRGEKDADGILERLNRLKGFCRAEIAAAIQRKRTPEIVFQLVADEPRRDNGDGTGGDTGDTIEDEVSL